MRNKIVAFCAIVMAAMVFSVQAGADGRDGSVMYFQVGIPIFEYRGQTRRLEAAPFIEGGRTMVPFRTIAEGLGAEIDWDDATRTVSFIREGTSAALTIGTALYDSGGDYMGTPVIVSGRTFVPVRYVSETFGREVRWDRLNEAIYIF